MSQRISRRRPRYADVAATVALIMAMGGTAYAATALPAKSVGAKQLKSSAVTTAKLHNLAVTSKKIALGAVGSAQIAPGSIGGTQIRAGSITGAQIAGASISGSEIAPNSINLKDLVGTDVSGGISFNLPANTCHTLTLGVSGAVVGQVAMISWEGNVTPPPNLAIGPLKVTAANKVAGSFCNVGSVAISELSLGVRIVTFG